ncbi:unnamed protein product [Paramecium pentaurelia]|uniref:Insertion element IS150 protein InsJ-like helix-turn-helix domain-containing protein n=1 Tax=Paramecium pentaurelia TaxID=43138 RepID=A0A8S1Y9I0_9CILI|nr:unnamed protein product [Paramecium pentaurelia]
MDSLNDGSQARKKYAVITPTVRMAFIKRVQSKQSTIKQAAQEFGIKFSTSKAILQTYRREGRIGKKKTRQRRSTFRLESQPQKPQEITKTKESLAPVQCVQNSPIDLQFQSLQLQLNQQIQMMQLSLSMNPYRLLQHQYLNQYLMQMQAQQMINMQGWQIPIQQAQTLPQQFGRIEEQRQYITPLQSSKCLDQNYDEGRSTLKDFI